MLHTAATDNPVLNQDFIKINAQAFGKVDLTTYLVQTELICLIICIQRSSYK